MKTNTYLGFIEALPARQQPRATKQLDKLVRYNGQIYNMKDYILLRLIEGDYADIRENYTYYKKDGELSKPKTLYMLMRSNGQSFFEVNKTQYDFINYCIENGLTSENAIINKDRAETEKKAEEERRETEKIRQEEEAKEAERIADKKFRAWITSEAEHIPQEQKDLISDIFIDIYGSEYRWNYTIAVCINNYDMPRCKQDIIERLHNHNKASIKIFECMTGLNLPKNHGERKEYLQKLTKSDFKGMTEYKPRKVRAKAGEKKLQEFYIVRNVQQGGEFMKVMGESIRKYGVDMFLHEIEGKFALSLKESGVRVTSGDTKTEVLENLKSFVDRKGKGGFVALVKDTNQKILNTVGENPLQKTA